MEKKFAKGDKVFYYNGIIKVNGTVFQANKTNIRVMTDIGQIVKLHKDKVHSAN